MQQFTYKIIYYTWIVWGVWWCKGMGNTPKNFHTYVRSSINEFFTQNKTCIYIKNKFTITRFSPSPSLFMLPLLRLLLLLYGTLLCVITIHLRDLLNFVRTTEKKNHNTFLCIKLECNLGNHILYIVYDSNWIQLYTNTHTHTH